MLQISHVICRARAHTQAHREREGEREGERKYTNIRFINYCTSIHRLLWLLLKYKTKIIQKELYE